MGVRIATEATVLYDSVTGLVIGSHIFEGGPEGETAQQEAEAFLRWTEDVEGILDVRVLDSFQMSAVVTEWINLVADHDEPSCPWDVDRDSYGIGFTGDSDHEYNDGSPAVAVPNSCDCQCHRRSGGVFHPATRR